MHRLLIVALATAACGDKGSAPAAGSAKPQMACIADHVAPTERVWTMKSDCATDACRDACETDHDSSSCMSRAIQLEKDPAQRDEANLMFIRACELGVIAGCTNYAGFLWQNNRGNAASACALALFEKTCAAKDPFGCGMQGRMIVDEANSLNETQHGRAILEGACNALGGFPCRVFALELEADRLGPYDPSQIGVLLARACGGGDQPACGSPKSVRETFR